MKNLSFCLKLPSRLLLSILNKFGTWLPDKRFLQIKFWLIMGYRLNIKNPKTFQEKIQWLKLYNRKSEYTKMVDKYAVKDYVSGIIGKEYIIPTIGVWDTVDKIDFDSLPDQFVLKTTHGGGGGGVIICRDKSMLDIESAKHKLNNSLKSDIYKYYREWPYKNVPRRIIAEKYLVDESGYELKDYKVFCFNGIPQFIQVIFDRSADHGPRINLYSTNWELLDAEYVYPSDTSRNVERPAKLEEMLAIASSLAKGHPFLRVDLYYTLNHVYLGELTFFPTSGLGKFTPEEWSTKFGECLNLESIETNELTN